MVLGRLARRCNSWESDQAASSAEQEVIVLVADRIGILGNMQ